VQISPQPSVVVSPVVSPTVKDGTVILHEKRGTKIGTITIKRLGIYNFPIKMGTSPVVLGTAVGVYRGSPAPGTGNFMMAGHRITPVRQLDHGPFYSMDKLKKGDIAVVKYDGEVYRFKVVMIKVVIPSSVVFRRLAHSNVDMTLTACHPIGSAQQRIVSQWKLI
jgi:sortase A